MSFRCAQRVTELAGRKPRPGLPRLGLLSAILATLLPLPACGVFEFVGTPDQGRVSVEVAVSEAGYGIDWYKETAQRYERDVAPPNVHIDLWGDPTAEDKVRPRLLRGNPPDLLLVRDIPHWMLIMNHKLAPLNDALEQNAYGADVPWQDLFYPGILSPFSSGDVVYAVPTAFGGWGCWYDARVFRERGWSVPQTWADFLSLCDAMKAEGIAPMAFQGKFAGGYGWYTLIALIQRCGGLEAINRINRMEPGSFTHPDVVRAAGLFQQLATNHFQKSAMAMTNIEAQLQFINGHAAMIFCGLWLENEMRSNIGPDFELRVFSIPAVEGGKGNPALFPAPGAEFLFVPADGRHRRHAIEFARYIVSPAVAEELALELGIISPLRGATPRDALSPALQSALDMVEASGGVFDVRTWGILLNWQQDVGLPKLAALLRGDITPEEFCRNMDDGMQAALQNPDLRIPPYTPYDPAAFGERS